MDRREKIVYDTDNVNCIWDEGLMPSYAVGYSVDGEYAGFKTMSMEKFFEISRRNETDRVSE